MPETAARTPLVTLIRPSRVSSAGNWSDPVTPPLGMAYLAAMLRQDGVAVKAVDGIGEAVDQVRVADGYSYQGLTVEQLVARVDPATTVIGVSAMFTQDWLWLADLVRALRVRFPSVPIVAG